MNNVVTIQRNTVPLCFIPDGRLVCYHRGIIEFFRDGLVELSFPIPISSIERNFGWCRYVSRLLRFGIRSAIALDNDHVLLCISNTIFELDVRDRRLSNGWLCGKRTRPLFFSEIKNIEGFEDGIYFGGYSVNMAKGPVSVYKRIGVDHWDVVYSFPQGVINHVHNIVADPYRKCLWIFTGDFGEAAAIWKVTDNFKKVIMVLSNDQRYRGCFVHALPEGLLYATDAPFADDFIYLLNPDTMVLKELFSMHGSCIYGCKWKDMFVLSSTVEGDGRDESLVSGLFNRKRGAGIKDQFVHLYVGNLSDGFQEVYKEKKDCMPFSFQFGAFKFPVGVNVGDTLYFHPVATKKRDLCLVAFT